MTKDAPANFVEENDACERFDRDGKRKLSGRDDIAGAEIEQGFLLGVNVMQKFEWTFPKTSPSASAESDLAVEGFHAFLGAVTRLSLRIRRLQQVEADSFTARVTNVIVDDWRDILNFLRTMYIERRLYSSKIRFAISKLSELSEHFQITEQEKFMLGLKTDYVEENENFIPTDEKSPCSEKEQNAILSDAFSCLTESSQKPGRENWKADEDVAECFGCSTAFGVFVRRHHCRACGLIFCNACSKHRTKFTPESRLQEENYKQKEKRVCETCYTRITHAKEVDNA
jgi:hypothetical protein